MLECIWSFGRAPIPFHFTWFWVLIHVALQRDMSNRSSLPYIFYVSMLGAWDCFQIGWVDIDFKKMDGPMWTCDLTLTASLLFQFRRLFVQLVPCVDQCCAMLWI